MLKVFARCGLALTTRREAGVVHVTLDLARGGAGPAGIQPKQDLPYPSQRFGCR